MSKGVDQAAVKAVHEYLVKQNRPYSAIDVFNNLHKAHGKTAVVKALEVLAEQGKIRSKVYGKQTVFVADQSVLPNVSDEELRTLDSSISQTQAKLKECGDCYRKLDTEFRNLSSSISTTEAEERLQLLVAQCEKFKVKLEHLKSNPNAVSPEKRQKIISERSVYVRQWRKRKRMANDMLSGILEGYPKSKRELYEEIGIETDDDHNVKPPEI